MTLRSFLGLLLISGSCAAQSGITDFSGVYLCREIKAPNRVSSACPGLVLQVKQSEEAVDFVFTQNGAATTERYRLKDTASFNQSIWGLAQSQPPVNRAGALTIESTAEVMQAPFLNKPGTVNTTSVWTLSADGNELTVTRKNRFKDAPLKTDFTETERFARRDSLQAAMAEAEKASEEQTCNSFPAPEGAEKLKYDEGALLGFTGFQRFDRCSIFSAVLWDKSFRGLRSHRSGSAKAFTKQDQAIQEYPDNVVLEVEPHTIPCESYLNARSHVHFSGSRVVIPFQLGTEIPAEFQDLHYRLRWIGAAERDLGEVPGKIAAEPWAEKRPAQKFYRLQVPSKGIPLTDTLEIRILTSSREQIGCIRGRL